VAAAKKSAKKNSVTKDAARAKSNADATLRRYLDLRDERRERMTPQQRDAEDEAKRGHYRARDVNRRTRGRASQLAQLFAAIAAGDIDADDTRLVDSAWALADGGDPRRPLAAAWKRVLKTVIERADHAMADQEIALAEMTAAMFEGRRPVEELWIAAAAAWRNKKGHNKALAALCRGLGVESPKPAEIARLLRRDRAKSRAA